MTKKQSTSATKQQHWVPRLYLKGWTHGKDQIWCFDKTNQIISSPNYKNVAGSTWFYDLVETLDPAKPELFQAVEKLLADIESKSAPLIKALRGAGDQLVSAWPGEPTGLGQLLSERGRHNLAGFMALQYLRTDDMRAAYRDAFTKFHQRAMENTVPIAFPSVDPKKFKVQIDENEIKKLHIEMLLEFPEYIPYFRDKFWIYGINVHAEPFVTSDNPVVKLASLIHPSIPFDGLESPGMRLVFPVWPRMAITMYDRQFSPNQAKWHRQLGFVTKQTVRKYNQVQLRQCRRQIYSSLPDFDFAKDICISDPSICQIDSSRYEPVGPEIDSMIAQLVQSAKTCPLETN
jgi:hypothetical protein